MDCLDILTGTYFVFVAASIGCKCVIARGASMTSPQQKGFIAFIVWKCSLMYCARGLAVSVVALLQLVSIAYSLLWVEMPLKTDLLELPPGFY